MDPVGDIANAVAFVPRYESSWITGQVLRGAEASQKSNCSSRPHQALFSPGLAETDAIQGWRPIGKIKRDVT